MKLRKAIIPMAAASHRELPLQHLTLGNGRTTNAIALQIDDLLAAGIEEVALITRSDCSPLLRDVVTRFGSTVTFIEQVAPLGFGHALACAESWISGEPFVAEVCDHVFVTHSEESCVRQLIQVANREDCAISAVQRHSESQLPYFGIVGGQRLRGHSDLYEIEAVLEKPTPTLAEARCTVPGLRQGTYLGFFGMHVLTPRLFDILRSNQAQLGGKRELGLTEALAVLGTRERYLACELNGQRVDLEGRFGMLRAQIALALSGAHREEVLGLMLEEVAQARAAGVAVLRTKGAA